VDDHVARQRKAGYQSGIGLELIHGRRLSVRTA
jgi:hypothetical protein